MERREEIEKGIIGLMRSLGISKVRMMLSLALIRAHQLHEEMGSWIASYHNSDRDMTAQEFLSKVRELSEGRDNRNLVRFGSYYDHPERYDKLKKTNQNDLIEDDRKD